MEEESRRELGPPTLTPLADLPLSFEASRGLGPRVLASGCLSVSSSNDGDKKFARGVEIRLAGCESLLLGWRIFLLGCSGSGDILLPCDRVASGLERELSGRASFCCARIPSGLGCELSG